MKPAFVSAITLGAAAISMVCANSHAQDRAGADQAIACPVDHDHLADVLKKSVKPGGGPSNGGLDNNEWAAVVNRQGIVCAVVFSGKAVDDQWLGSRAIAAE